MNSWYYCLVVGYSSGRVTHIHWPKKDIVNCKNSVQLRAITESACVCGHEREPHRHFNHISNCALCDCKKYRKKRWQRS